MVIDRNGNIGIGDSVPSEKLTVAGNIKANGTTYTSDVRFKQNINPITDGLKKALALRGVTYDWNLESYPTRGFTKDKQIGFIAQEVEPIIPEMVSTGRDGYKSIDYSKLGPILIEAIKEQQNQINELKSENAALKTRMSELELRK